MSYTPSIYKFKAPLYKTQVWVVVGSSVGKSIDYVEDLIDFKIHSDENRSSTRAYTYSYVAENHKQRALLFFKEGAKAGEIAHEVKHLINILFSWYGVKLSTANDEHECYYLEQIIDKVHYYMDKHKKK